MKEALLRRRLQSLRGLGACLFAGCLSALSIFACGQDNPKTSDTATASAPAAKVTASPKSSASSAGIKTAADPSSKDQANNSPCCKKPPVKPDNKPDLPNTTAVYQRDLPRCVDAKQFASEFGNDLFPQVKATKQVGQERVLFFLDSTKRADGKPPDLSGVEKEIDEVVKAVEENCDGSGVEYYRYPPKTAGAQYCDGNSRSAGPCDLSPPTISEATLTSWKAGIPGVDAVLPLPDGGFLFVIKLAPDSGSTLKMRDVGLVERQIREVIDNGYAPVPPPLVVSLPPGLGGAVAIAPQLNHRVHNASVIASGETHVLVTPGPGDESPDVRERIKREVEDLLNELAVPTKDDSPKVAGQFTRLYYLRDAGSVAKILNNALPDVTVAAVGLDSVMLTAALPERATHPGEHNSGERNLEALRTGQRLLAQMDQPHAQVSLFTWALQISDKEQNDPARRAKSEQDDIRLQAIHSLATVFNQRVSEAVNAGWEYLRNQIASGDRLPGGDVTYFDPVYAGYLRSEVSFSKAARSEVVDIKRSCCGSRPEEQLQTTRGYGLGFNRLFSDLSPNLMNMLVVVSAAKQPVQTADCLLDRLEQKIIGAGGCSTWNPATPPSEKWTAPCQALDQKNYDDDLARSGFQAECTRKMLHESFAADASGIPNRQLGRFRAALADFLFQYKLMVQYPDDFDGYLEPASAAQLDTQLVELVDAFESDLEVLNYSLRDKVALALSSQRKDGSYDYSGIVSVKVIAGQEAAVQSTAQNYFPVNTAKTLADFASALTAAEQNQPMIVSANLPADAATGALAALAQLTPTKQTVSIGRELDMTITPYSLSAASGAEMDVEVTAKENGVNVVGATPTGTNTTVDDLSSRVSNHYVKSHVRLQSLKLFELSALDSTLAHGKTPWKPVDPYFEIPLIGDLVRKPRRPDLIRQRSVVFVSAVVVPTAADLAATPLVEDRYSVGGGQPRTPHSLSDLSTELRDRITQYHHRMLEYLSSATTDSSGVVSQPLQPPAME